MGRCEAHGCTRGGGSYEKAGGLDNYYLGCAYDAGERALESDVLRAVVMNTNVKANNRLSFTE